MTAIMSRTASCCRCAGWPGRTSCRWPRDGSVRGPLVADLLREIRDSGCRRLSPTGTCLRATSMVLTTVLPSFQTSWNFRSPRISTWSCFSFFWSLGVPRLRRTGDLRVGVDARHLRPHRRDEQERDQAEQKVDERDQGDLVIEIALAAVTAADVYASHGLLLDRVVQSPRCSDERRRAAREPHRRELASAVTIRQPARGPGG